MPGIPGLIGQITPNEVPVSQVTQDRGEQAEQGVARNAENLGFKIQREYERAGTAIGRGIDGSRISPAPSNRRHL